MSQFTLLVLGDAQSPGTRRAFYFAKALLESGHKIKRVFFYQKAVSVANQQLVLPQDEKNLAALWQALVQQQQLDAVVCIAAGLRRGVINQLEAKRYDKDGFNLANGFELAGLGQLHEAIQLSERLITFGED